MVNAVTHSSVAGRPRPSRDVAIGRDFPSAASLPDVTYQIGRTYYQESRFGESADYFDRVLNTYPQSPSARDALGFKASALARLGQFDRSIETYRDYISRFP